MNIRLSGICLILLAISAFFLASCAGSGGGGNQPAFVVSTSPVNGATNVPTNYLTPGTSVISATFSQDMLASTVNNTTFYASTPTGPLVGAVTYSNKTATLTLKNALPASTVITATLTTGILVEGPIVHPGIILLKQNYTWSFTTSGNDAAPQVTSTTPLNAAVGVSLSSNITATFNKAMNGATLNSATFTLTGPTSNSVRAKRTLVSIPSNVTYVNGVATLTPTSVLSASTIYTATITSAVTDASGTPLAANYTWTFTTSATDLAPTVISTLPGNSATGISTSTSVSATFSEAMSAASINSTTFVLKSPAGIVVPATVTYANNMAILSPTTPLVGGSTYTGVLTAGVQDVAGTPLASAYIWSFTTSLSDVAPTVASTTPVNSAINVAVNGKVTATFSEAMASSTITGTSFSLVGPDGLIVPASVSYANEVATLTPSSVLLGNATYGATISTGVKDVAGTSLASAKTWTFKTISKGASPTVLSTNPVNNSINVKLNQAINATFSESMLASSINSSTFTVQGVSGSVTYFPASNIASFVPSTNLLANTTYTATIQSSVRDLSNNDMAASFSWQFTTGTQLAQGSINLGSATTFGVLAGSTVTNGGPTSINGDLGVSPGTAVVGFPPGTLTGAIHAGDAVAAKAKSDLLQGQLDAAGRLGATALAGDLSGLTIYPGLYKNSSSVMVSSGNVTFDAQGDPNAVFIMQMGTTLTTGTGTGMVLAGGAQASNIYWSVGSSATLGVNSSFMGVILSQASITANTGCTIHGVLLTNTGGVTMESNTITPRLRKKGGAAPPTRH